ncbi:MAG: hypothetical protein HYZ25_19220 [Chloroflexi bacterium]|nr:hypothetical protein [Chloroflexota bacterium]
MKKVFSTIAGLAFYAFVLAVGAFTVSLTLSEVRSVLPNDPIAAYFALALFDGGAFAWLMSWLYKARGLPQRAISLIMLVVDLAGVLLMAGGRLLLGGQTLTDAPETLGAAVVYGIMLITLLNLAAAYGYHITDPDTIQEIELAVLQDTLEAEALDQAKANIEAEAQGLGAILAARATGQLKYKLRLPIGDDEAAALDGVALPAEPEQIQPSAIITPRPAQRAELRKPSTAARWIVNLAGKARGLFARRPAPIAQPTAVFETSTAAADLKPAAQDTPKAQPEAEQTPAQDKPMERPEPMYHPIGLNAQGGPADPTTPETV